MRRPVVLAAGFLFVLIQVALVTAEQQNQLLAVALPQGRVVRRVSLPELPGRLRRFGDQTQRGLNSWNVILSATSKA